MIAQPQLACCMTIGCIFGLLLLNKVLICQNALLSADVSLGGVGCDM